jgi:hypothetical protein
MVSVIQAAEFQLLRLTQSRGVEKVLNLADLTWIESRAEANRARRHIVRSVLTAATHGAIREGDQIRRVGAPSPRPLSVPGRVQNVTPEHREGAPALLARVDPASQAARVARIADSVSTVDWTTEPSERDVLRSLSSGSGCRRPVVLDGILWKREDGPGRQHARPLSAADQTCSPSSARTSASTSPALVRAEGWITIERCLDCMGDVRLSEEYHGPPGACRCDHAPSWIFLGVAALHLEFTPQ